MCDTVVVLRRWRAPRNCVGQVSIQFSKNRREPLSRPRPSILQRPERRCQLFFRPNRGSGSNSRLRSQTATADRSRSSLSESWESQSLERLVASNPASWEPREAPGLETRGRNAAEDKQLGAGFAKSAGIRTFILYNIFELDPSIGARSSETLFTYLAGKKIKPHIYERIPLAEAARAHELLESGRVQGKLILKP